MAMFSIVATETSVLTFVSIPSIAYFGDWYFMQLVLGFVVGRVIVSIFILPLYFKSKIVSEGLIITLGVFSFIELFFLGMAVDSGLQGDFQGVADFNWFSYIGLWGYLITSVVIAFHIKNQISMVYIKQKIKFESNPIYNFNVFFTILFGVMYVCYKLNQIQRFSK